MALRAALCFLLGFFLLIAGDSTAFEPLNHEVVALVGIKGALSDPNGVLKNWDEDSADPCSWTMITCSAENRVIVLGAPSQNLSGTLSGAIGNLTDLQQVSDNQPLRNQRSRASIFVSLTLPPSLSLSLSQVASEQQHHRRDSAGAGDAEEAPDARPVEQRVLRRRTGIARPTGVSPLPKAQQQQLVRAIPCVLDEDPSALVPRRVFQQSLRSRSAVPGEDLQHSGESSDLRQSLHGRVLEGGDSCLAYAGGRFLSECAGKTKTQKVAIAVGTSLSSASVLVLLAGLLCWRRNQRHQSILGISEKEEGAAMASELGNLHQFGLRELQIATDNFSSRNILGKGGFGNVYKGRLADGTVVAVKRLKDVCSSGEVQFRTEVEMISLAVHRNLLRLLGFCSAPNERLLVYPFMPNGSVAARLRGKPVLDWSARRRIAVGAARGLLYLHEQCDPKIIHRDVKAANILLDEGFEAVVGDFGLAKLLDHGDSHVTTAVRGTVGHIAPEYLSTGQSSEKTDVFGFGILLLELVSGRNALDFSAKGGGATMLDWVRKAHQERQLDLLVDRNLRSGHDRVEVAEMVQVALLCTHYSPTSRPKMSEVVRMLEGEGLAEKWAAANKLAGGAPPRQSTGAREQQLSPPADLLLMDGGDEDGDRRRSLDAAEMELSGPR